MSQHILTEYKVVLSRPKFRLTPELQEQWFDLLDTFPTVAEVDLAIDFPIDPSDAKFLTCAIAANADFLITRDNDLAECESLIATAIVTVASFKASFCGIEQFGDCKGFKGCAYSEN